MFCFVLLVFFVCLIAFNYTVVAFSVERIIELIYIYAIFKPVFSLQKFHFVS